jgi:hypothetical protein
MQSKNEMRIPLDEIREIDRIEDRETKVYEAAKLYVRHGFQVLPVRPRSKWLPEASTGINYSSAAKRLSTVDNWFGPGGRFRGWNLAIACGATAFAIDVDRHGDEDGLEQFKQIVEEYGDPEAPSQRTPKGGLHYIFQWRDNARSTTKRIASSIDTRGGDGRPQSHIVVWPSITDDGSYEWVSGGDVPVLPQWVTDILGTPWNRKAGRGSEEVKQEDEEDQFTVGQIQSMLDAIDVDMVSYDEWLMVGQAINTQFPDERGYELWHNWSKVGKRYKQDECKIRWRGFKPHGPIRVGTLIHIAKLNGWTFQVQGPGATGDFAEIIEKMNKDNAVIVTGGKVKIASRDGEGNVHVFSREDFAALMFNRPVTIMGSRKRVTEADIWMAAEERRTCVNGLGFFPDKPLFFNNYVNLWRGWGVDPVEGDWSLFKAHIAEVICNGDEKLNEYVLDWMADIFQNPMRPKGVALVIHGQEGTGKGSLAKFLGKACGHHFAHVTHERHLIGNFNSHMMDKLLVFADEVVYGGSRQTAGILKALVTEERLVCERKGLDPFFYDNRARLIIASNEDWFVPAGAESRRWLVLDVNNKYASNVKYFNRLYSQMDNGGVAAMMAELMQRQIKSNLALAPVTSALNNQRQIYTITGDAVSQWLDYCTQVEWLGTSDDVEASGWPKVVDRILLYESFMKWAKDNSVRGLKGSSHFYAKLAKYGFEQYRPESNGVRRYKYRVPPLTNVKKDLGHE